MKAPTLKAPTKLDPTCSFPSPFPRLDLRPRTSLIGEAFARSLDTPRRGARQKSQFQITALFRDSERVPGNARFVGEGEPPAPNRRLLIRKHAALTCCVAYRPRGVGWLSYR